MMDEWVDDRWQAMDAQILAVSGTDFKHLALSPHEGCAATEGRSCISDGEEPMLQPGEDEAWRGGRARASSPSRRGSMVVRGPRRHPRFAELTKRNSNRLSSPRRSNALFPPEPSVPLSPLATVYARPPTSLATTAATAFDSARPALQVHNA